jgi:CelD/BcsL family acetyltransferase involved in cellulose biosynthesis
LALEQGGGFWLLRVGYDQRFAQCSPGQLLVRDTIRYAVEAGLESYEFLGSAESWSERWTNTKHPCVSLWVYPLGVRGIAALVADAASVAYRRWTKQPC